MKPPLGHDYQPMIGEEEQDFFSTSAQSSAMP
jgi:hypothetical protein